MARSEAEVRAELIDPAVRAAGWSLELVTEEYPYRRGRIRLIGEHVVRDDAQFVDYLLHYKPAGPPLAVLEAKDESHSPGAGLQQAMAYAADLGAPFAYSSNGNGFVEHDFLTLTSRPVEELPSHAELLARAEAGQAFRGPMVVNRRGVTVRNPLIEPTASSLSGMRYYQEQAVAAALDQLLLGRHRALLSLATGTGKTFIALNFVSKLLTSGFGKRVLFLADRVSLRDQAYNEFAPLGSDRAVVDGPELPFKRNVHFAIYQGLYAPLPGGRRLFEEYPPDFFDAIVIDECHRSGYGDWAEILDYFQSAFHLGLTATPKRSDSFDTYEAFAGENRNSAGEPTPAYEYSLGAGIDDGFLATYRVHQVQVDIDSHGLHIGQELSRGAELVVPEGADLKDAYGMGQFEREIVVPDRTRVLCEHLAGLLRRLGANDKTIVFCVTAAHADLVRTYMQELMGPDTGKNLYAVRIVGEERDAQDLLAEFQLSSSTQPVLATTVDLLTTGVNAPSVRNIVFMKPVASTTTFKQIIGRGTRLDPATGKEFFRIIDYTNATRLFDVWDLPPAAPSDQNAFERDGVVTGVVRNEDDGLPIEGALVVARRGLRSAAETYTPFDGTYELRDLPRTEISIQATARGYRRREVTLDLTDGSASSDFTLSAAAAASSAIVISGVEVRIATETQLVLDNGSELTIEQFVDYVGEQVREQTGDLSTLRELWTDPSSRDRLRASLKERRVDSAILAILLNRPDADGFDLLAKAGFASRIQSREERARALEQDNSAWRMQYSEAEFEIIQALLDKYRIGGVDEVSSSDAFRASPFAELGGIQHLVKVFGTAARVGHMLRDVQSRLYSDHLGDVA